MSDTSGFRLSPQQARLWSHLAPTPSASARARAVLMLEGPMDASRLERAVRGLISQHEILRTSYRRLAGTGAAVQVPGDVPATVLEVLDWSALPAAEAQARLESLLSAEASPEEAPAPFKRVVLGTERQALVVDLPAPSMDRQSLLLLARELGAALEGAGAADAEPPPQYADVAEVFHQLLESEETSDGRRYWKSRDLSGATGTTLSTRRPGAGGSWTRPGRQSLALSARTASALEALAGRLGARVADVVLAGWMVLLARMGGLDEACVAVRYDGRTFEGLDVALGLFERWLPMRAPSNARVRFEEWVREVARECREAEAWQDYFEASAFLPGATPGAAPPPLSFSFAEATRPAPVQAGGLEVSITHVESRTERAELALTLVRGEPGASSLELEHDASAYTSSEATRLLERLEALLSEAAASPERALEALPWVSAQELRALAGFNATARDYDTDGTLPARFDARARATPDAVAVAFEDDSLSFSALAERANRMAWHLRAKGVGPEVRVAVCLERSVEQFVVLLAILKAGGAFVPLDPTYPRERLAYVIQQSGAPLVITRSHLRRAVLPEGTHTFVCLDEASEAIAASPAHAPEVTLAPENVAYVIFTSGSTGRPKGVMIPHRSALNLAATLRDTVYQGRGPGLRVSVNAPLVFDASVKQWLQLLNGHSLHIVPEEVRPDAERMRAWVQRHAVDVLDCTPSLLVPMLARGLGREPDFSPLMVLVGGEAIDARTWAELAARPATRFVNMYGPTECTVNATTCPISDSAEPSIGGPLGNVRVHVLDAGLRPVPLGVPGELFIGGAGVGRGYDGRPELTAERFVPDPFSPVPGARLYRTGDVGRYREDGRIEFSGRADFQVKVRGYRIEPGEIESLMRAHPEVAEAVVLVREGEARLVGYFVPRSGGADAELAAQLRGFLREKLPEYMLPSVLVPLARMPLTRNGKVDRGALPDPAAVQRDAAPYEAPTSELEQRIASIWQEALKVERVGLHGNFFDLGGHSLLMVQVHEKLSAAFGRRFSMVELFQHPTVASLAKYIAQQSSPDDAKQQARDERARKQHQAMQQQALKAKAGRGKR
ncbi:amino acid adenylation domain-containing protein [Pyxidicoccus fallax]|uniref:Amino acid adenylation domain-containing protein n=1 Tax=Pyxidicoccus fallax TaxID=394095 RepID=A0A848LEJ9_9BACT|nr:non-ribosomal peptide synthetase [Pyxidicoccus fallax]NMO13898.1 amino acid adenylation domain-containing protein [Pyxidicoccus fallax]NPC81277.1 amino acid adenylation domain-containing protein [Pyxidicoccus fallax]